MISRFCVLSIIALWGGSGLNSEEFAPGHILTPSGNYVVAEYVESEGGYFVRNDRIGGRVPESAILNIVTADYFELIRRTSPLRAALESVVFFDAAAEYRWPGSRADRVRTKNRQTAIFKSGLLGLSALLYWQAYQSNERIKRSFLFLNDASAKKRFRRDWQAFNLSAIVAAVYFSWVAVDAYFSHGIAWTGENLRIQTATELSVDDFLKPRSQPDLTLQWSFAF